MLRKDALQRTFRNVNIQKLNNRFVQLANLLVTPLAENYNVLVMKLNVTFGVEILTNYRE